MGNAGDWARWAYLRYVMALVAVGASGCNARPQNASTDMLLRITCAPRDTILECRSILRDDAPEGDGRDMTARASWNTSNPASRSRTAVVSRGSWWAWRTSRPRCRRQMAR